ncbi:glycosyltransferase, partial [Genlisea aurea]
LMDHMGKYVAMKAIGPTVPSMYSDERLPEDREYGLSFFLPESTLCTDWLNRQPPASVVYVAFGSMAQLSQRQMEELARALEQIRRPFIWVVRSSERNKLPPGFPADIAAGLIVSWSPQLDVLAHRSVACFVTHCGWNSTLEALCLGVPVVALPQGSDQTTNSKFVADVWRTGVRAVACDGDGGVVDRITIERCVRDVIEGEE